MIAVLQDWQEIGDSIIKLNQVGARLHDSVEKNWDHAQLYELIDGLSRSARVVDESSSSPRATAGAEHGCAP